MVDLATPDTVNTTTNRPVTIQAAMFMVSPSFIAVVGPPAAGVVLRAVVARARR